MWRFVDSFSRLSSIRNGAFLGDLFDWRFIAYARNSGGVDICP
jgi:hypothetical protein